ncbi:MAG: hypothetical protein E7007_03690 [Alphaproteobacteria bacterium]|nr:hypothetical protein [Alphaproteobacteria bacterium]
MSQLIQIADFQFIALKDSIDMTEQDRKKYLTMSIADFPATMVDVPTSLALLDQLRLCPLGKGHFRNDLEKEIPQIIKTDDFVYVCPQHSIKNTQIPLVLQKAGIKIKREQRIAYIVPGPDSKEPYVLVDKNGAPFETLMVSGGRHNNLNIEIYDDILALRPEEYEKYLRLKKQIETGHVDNINKKDEYIYMIVDTFAQDGKSLDIVFHELKHAQNSLIFFDYLFDNPNCKLSGVDIYKYEQYNEMSAKLAEAIEAINTYNQSDNKQDLSLFESSFILQKLLYNKSVQEREKLLSDIPYIVRMVCSYWNEEYATEYASQVIRNTSIELQKVPSKHLVYESDGTAYNDIRKSMFNYNVYDKKTGRYINMDLSEYITDIDIKESDIKVIQQMFQDVVIKHKKRLSTRSDEIQYDLIGKAQHEYEKLVNETEYRKTLYWLQSKGMDYNSALNFVSTNNEITQPAEPKIVQETTNRNIVKYAPAKKQKRNILLEAVNEVRRRILLKKLRKKANGEIRYL